MGETETGRAGEMIHRRLIMGNPLQGGAGVGSFSCFGIYFGIPPSPIHRGLPPEGGLINIFLMNLSTPVPPTAGLPPEGGLILEVLAELCFIIAS